MTQQKLSLHVGKIRHMASIYRLLAAFAGDLEIWADFVKHLSHHLRITRSLRSDITLTIWRIKRAADYGNFFDQFLKPMDIPDVTFYTDDSLNMGLGGYSNKDHWF